MPENYSTNPNPDQDSTDPNGGIIQNPKLNSKGKPTQRAIKDAKMAVEVVKTLLQANRNRQIVNGRIMAKYNAERPYIQGNLEREGLGWRSNFTTKPLPQMIEKVTPRFIEAIDGLKYFTNSELSDKWENSVEKTEKFRAGLTELIKTRKGWRTMLDSLSLDNALFGHTTMAWLDEFTWFPKHFKQEESALPDGTKQEARLAQVIVLKETYLPHELYAEIQDRETAAEVGWNIKNAIEAINTASPSNLRENLANSGTTEAWYQNAQRELTVGASYTHGANVIVVYSILVREVTGKVSHYRVSSPDYKEIFTREDRFDAMEDCAVFFSYQKGNDTMAGSKGIGRDIYEMAAMIDRNRNEVVDRAILSGKTLVQGNTKQLHKFRMSVVGSTMIIPDGWTVLQQKIDGNVEPFLKLDAYFGMLVDQLVGSTSPRTFSGERVTAAEVNLFASREEEGKDARITRFLEQFVNLVGTMQKRICDPDTVEEDAQKFQERMLEIMTPEELEELRMSPVASTIRDLSPLDRQLAVMVANEKKGNPLYNQRQLEIEDLTARLGSKFADRVLLPANDPTEQAEQQRLQQLEFGLLTQGQPVPVSPRDNHEIHLSVLMPTASAVGQAVGQGQVGTAVFEAVVGHINEHYTRAKQAGNKSDIMNEVEAFLKDAIPAIAELKAVDDQAAQMQSEAEAQGMAEDGAAPPENF